MCQKNASSSDYYVDVDLIKAGVVYNRTAAVSYAATWAHGRNSAYPNYGNKGDNPCNDCTNYVSQVLEAGAIPRITDLTQDNEYFWYTWYDLIQGWRGSRSWAATDWFKRHNDAFVTRYQFVGTTATAIESLSKGDFFLMDDDDNPVSGADHASVIVGRGVPQEGDGTGEHQLRNAHCTDRYRVRWNYKLGSGDFVWAYKIIY
jgi:hypothetical protein